ARFAGLCQGRTQREMLPEKSLLQWRPPGGRNPQGKRLIRTGPGISKEFCNHMKRLLTVVSVLAMGLTPLARAQKPAAATTAAPSAKIAVIAFQAAVAKTNEGQKSFADL